MTFVRFFLFFFYKRLNWLSSISTDSRSYGNCWWNTLLFLASGLRNTSPSCEQCRLNDISAGVRLTDGLAKVALCVHAHVASVVNGDLILVLCSSLWTPSWLMNAEQRGGMALNKDFRSKTGNGSVSREGRAIATPTGELHPQHLSLPPSLPHCLHLSLFISPSLFLYFPLTV